VGEDFLLLQIKRAVTESWNGTSWTPVSSLNTSRNWPGGAGIQTAALAFGGGDPLIQL
jgi:hypothetical protein